MADPRQLEDIVKRLGAAIRSSGLYSSVHPLVHRSVDSLHAALDQQLRRTPVVSIAFLGNDIVVGRTRLKGSASLAGLIRHFRERQVDKLTFSKELTQAGLQALVALVADRDVRSVAERLKSLSLKGVAVATISADEAPSGSMGIAMALQAYGAAVNGAEMLWGAAESGDEADAGAAQVIIDTLSKAVSQDRASMMALTSLKAHDQYTFTHMVNVSLLAMAQARTLGISGSLLREFGMAGLMHDIGKVKVPAEILTKPDRLTAEETQIMRRHVVDGAQILRHTRDMPALVPVVAFEHHLKHDLSGYPERLAPRRLNLCTMLVTIADVFDALRTKRVYRDGLPAARVRKMLAEQSGTAFEPTLLRRFISLVGIFPVGTGVRLKTGELCVVTEEHPTDSFRPKVRIVVDARGDRVHGLVIVDTSEHDEAGRHAHVVLEAIDMESLGFDPLALMPS